MDLGTTNNLIIRSDRLYEKVASKIQEMILQNQLRAGEKLPSEAELTSNFGVSRTSIREAIKLLKERGLVEIIHGRGVYITEPTTDSLTNNLTLLFHMKGQNIENIYEIRRVLELAIAPLAAERATEADIKELEQAISKMDMYLDNTEEYVRADMEFHLTLANATQNILFLVLIMPVIDILTEDRAQIHRVTGAPHRGQIGHAKILEAVKERNPEKAREAMLEHLDTAEVDARRATNKEGDRAD